MAITRLDRLEINATEEHNRGQAPVFLEHLGKIASLEAVLVPPFGALTPPGDGS